MAGDVAGMWLGWPLKSRLSSILRPPSSSPDSLGSQPGNSRMGEPSKVLLGVNVHPEPLFQEPGGPTPVQPGGTPGGVETGCPPGSRGCRDGQRSLTVPSEPWAGSRGRYGHTATGPCPGAPQEWRGVLIHSEPLGFSPRGSLRNSVQQAENISESARPSLNLAPSLEGARGLST